MPAAGAEKREEGNHPYPIPKRIAAKGRCLCPKSSCWARKIGNPGRTFGCLQSTEPVGAPLRSTNHQIAPFEEADDRAAKRQTVKRQHRGQTV